MKGIITVVLKQDILDPQGRAVMSSLQGLGFGEVQDVRIGKSIEIELDGLSVDEADSRLRRMSESILVNPVIEDYQIEIVEDRCAARL